MKTNRKGLLFYSAKKGNEFHLKIENFEPCEKAFMEGILQAMANEEDRLAVRKFMLEGGRGVIIMRFGGRITMAAPMDDPKAKGS